MPEIFHYMTPDGSPMPYVGARVLYRSRTGNYTLPAIVTATTDSIWEEGVERGDISPITDKLNVHLHVFTPGEDKSYQEFDVPYAPWEPDPEPRSWTWMD